MQFVSQVSHFSVTVLNLIRADIFLQKRKSSTLVLAVGVFFFLAQLMVATLGVVMPKEEVDVGVQPQAKCKSRTGRNAHFSCSLPEGTEMASAKEKGFEDFLKKKIKSHNRPVRNSNFSWQASRCDARTLKEPNEFHVKWGRKTRPINVRLEEISDMSRCCNSFAGAAVSSNRNTAGRPKWKKRRRRCAMGDWKRRQRDRREGVPACVCVCPHAEMKSKEEK